MRLNLVLLFVILALALTVFKNTTQAHPASGIIVDTKGNVYFSDLETIWKIDQSGNLSVFRSGVRGRHVHELAIDKDDNIFGADISYKSKKWISSVWKMTPAGSFSYLLEPTSDPPVGMSIWRDAQGNMYWVDQNNHTKTKTLLLRRTPSGVVTTLAGSAYGQADGKGTQARFGSIGGMTFGVDGSIYLTDGDSLRKVTMDGTVTTLGRGLNVRTLEDSPTLFGGNHGSLAGLTAGADGESIFVADSGNRRLLKVTKGKVDVVLRSEAPFFPTGAAATESGDVYVLEVGLTIPNVFSGPRIRKISPDGTITVVATVGEDRSRRSTGAIAFERAGVTAESVLQFVLAGRATKYAIATAPLMAGAFLIWRRRRKVRRV